MRKLALMLCVTCLFAIASADHRNCWAVTWSWFDNNAGGSETKPTAEDFADSEKAPPVGMPDGVPAVQKHGKCLCGEHEHKIEIIENMKYWWLKDYDLCSEDDTIYYVNASDFADGMTEQDAYTPGGIWTFKALWPLQFHADVPPHSCGEYTWELWLEYKYVSEAGSLDIEKGSSTEVGLSGGAESENGTEVGPEGPKVNTSSTLKVGASFSASAFGKKGMSVSFSWVLMKKGPENWGPGGTERTM